MKIKIKTLRGILFDIDVKPEDIVADVKKNIETVLGPAVYPAAQQMLIHQGEVLKDTTTLEENKVTKNSFVVIMLSKSMNSASRLPTTSSAATNVAQPSPASQSAPSVTPRVETNAYVAVASDIVAESVLEIIVQKMIELGRGRWDRETFIRILLVAFNNPVRAEEYLYFGIPEQAEVEPLAKSLVDQLALNPAVGPTLNALNLLLKGLLPHMDLLENSPQVVPEQADVQPVAPAVGPNANPLNLFPQELPNMDSNASANTLDLLRNSAHFQSFRAVMRAHPQFLQPVFQDLWNHNPVVMWWIRRHKIDFLRLMIEPLACERNLWRQIQLTGRVPDNFSLTPEKYRSLRRLEAMGYTLSLALEVFLACNKNEVLAAFFLIGLRS